MEKLDNESVSYLKIVKCNESIRPYFSKLHAVTGRLIHRTVECRVG